MIAITHDDLVVGRGDGVVGVAIPEALLAVPDERLRLRDGVVIDVTERTAWFVDRDGLKHVEPGDGREPLACALSDELERVDGAWRVADPLARLKARLKAEIDAEAERQRLRWITHGDGQAMEYQQAAVEATALLAALSADPEHDPDEASYPMLAASLGIDGETLFAVATKVAAMHRQWQAVGSAIRGARLSAKQAIDEAADAVSARAVQPVWPA